MPSDVENTPVAVTRAFYAALLDRNAERANQFAHPNAPESEFPLTEDDLPPEGSSIELENAVLAEEADGAAAVEVTLDADGNSQTITIGLRTHEDSWRMYRSDGCTKVEC